VRCNRNKSKFWVNTDWYRSSRNSLSYDRYIVGQKDDTRSKLFYFTDYNVSVNNTYPTPDYTSGIESIVTDALISQLFKNNIGNGFSLTKIISSYKGVPDDDSKRKATKAFDAVFSGVDGSSMLLDFNNAGDK